MQGREVEEQTTVPSLMSLTPVAMPTAERKTEKERGVVRQSADTSSG